MNRFIKSFTVLLVILFSVSSVNAATLTERLKAGHPCSICDADGLVLGKNHMEAWNSFY